MNIVIVAYDLARDKIGGVQNRMTRLISGLTNNNKLSQITVFNHALKTEIHSTNENLDYKNFFNLNELYREARKFLNKNKTDLLYFADYRHIRILRPEKIKYRPKSIVASVPDIDLARSKYCKSSNTKIETEKKTFKYLNRINIDYFHVSCEAHKSLVNKFTKNKKIDFVITPIGLKKDYFKISEKKFDKLNAIIASRSKEIKLLERANYLSKIKILNKTTLFTNEFPDYLSKKVLVKNAKSFEKLIPHYKKSHLIVDFSPQETFSNSLVEGSFYGCVPVINKKNFISLDLFDGNVLYDTRLNEVKKEQIVKMSKDIFSFSRRKFDLKKNVCDLLTVVK